MAETPESAASRQGEVTVSPEAVERLHLSPEERAERGVTDEDVREAFLAVAQAGDAEQKNLGDVTLPDLSLDRLHVDSENRHPLDLTGATIGDISARESVIELPIRLDGATVGEIDFDGASVRDDFFADDVTVTGPVTTFETVFSRQVSFEDATFEAEVDLDEAEFDEDVSLDRATFEADLRARAAEFYGDSNLLDDNTSFTGAVFDGEANFRQARFGFVHFEECEFVGDAKFEEAVFDGDAEFTGSEFDGAADFDEIRVFEDAGFDGIRFHGGAHFRGAVFEGGQRALEDDTSFAESVFDAEALFEAASFRFVTFEGAHFGAECDFTEAEFGEDARFVGVRFDGRAVFEESRFGEDGNFTDAVFEAECAFQGTEFAGGANRTQADACFQGTRFETDAHFHGITTRSANFLGAAFGGEIDFTDSEFTERIDFSPQEIDTDVFVDFTRTKIRSGKIFQPAENWVRYDLTLASLGDVRLLANSEGDRRRLLDYFRFCQTEFGEFDGHEFDFGDHREYLDRNGWSIHEFDEPADVTPDYAVEMTPDTISTTYLKAKQAARNDGDMKIAGEFRVKRQQYNRRQNLDVIRDGSADFVTRVKNVGRAAENYLLGISCGHGMRPIRIGAAFLIAPLFFVPLYAFGGGLFETSVGQLASIGDLATPEGRSTFYKLVHFSYISYTTIGYGNIGPTGALARLLAAAEAYLSVVLSALFVYALVKRSEL